MKNFLHIDASGRKIGSNSRKLSALLVKTFSEKLTNNVVSNSVEVIYRDVSQGLPYVDDAMITSYFTTPDERSEELNQAIVESDHVVQELKNSDVIVIGVPIYNFTMPAGLKAWADLAARAGLTFQYTENGPVGLLENKKAYVVVTSGGVPLDSPVDFLTPWIRQFLGFIGINDVTIIDACVIGKQGDAVIRKAEADILALVK